jgi:hypothetical protein
MLVKILITVQLRYYDNISIWFICFAGLHRCPLSHEAS